MKRGPIEVGDLSFGTQKDLTAYVRAIRDKYPDGARIEPPDDRFLYHLIKRHPDHSEGFRRSIDHFFVGRDGYGSRCFNAVDHAGASTPVSFRKCVTGRGSTAARSACEAARYAVADQVLQFRDQALALTAACALCLEPVTIKTCHVDHRPPFTFKRLWQVFRQKHPDLDLAVVEARTRPGVREFRNFRTRLEWSAFHGQHAQLRLLCIKDNLSTTRRGQK